MTTTAGTLLQCQTGSPRSSDARSRPHLLAVGSPSCAFAEFAAGVVCRSLHHLRFRHDVDQLFTADTTSLNLAGTDLHDLPRNVRDAQIIPFDW